MPNETGPAFLVGPAGSMPEAIDGRVYEVLLRYLNLPDGSPAREAVEWLLNRATETPGLDDMEVLGQSIWHYANTYDHSQTIGVLASVHGTGEISDLTKEETEFLQDTLTVIRAGGWLAHWLEIVVGRIAQGTDPIQRHPTPLQIMSSLREDALQHDMHLEIAQDMARIRPDLLFPAPADQPPSPPEQPAAPETTQPPASKPAKAQSTRQPRKKVARA
jgi:hypothetical protein